MEPEARLAIAKQIADHKRDPQNHALPPIELLRELIDDIRVKRADFVAMPSKRGRSASATGGKSTATQIDFSDLGF